VHGIGVRHGYANGDGERSTDYLYGADATVERPEGDSVSDIGGGPNEVASGNNHGAVDHLGTEPDDRNGVYERDNAIYGDDWKRPGQCGSELDTDAERDRVLAGMRECVTGKHGEWAGGDVRSASECAESDSSDTDSDIGDGWDEVGIGDGHGGTATDLCGGGAQAGDCGGEQASEVHRNGSERSGAEGSDLDVVARWRELFPKLRDSGAH
jgi:hypothetical protein